MQLVDVFRARIVDVAPDSLMVEITGTEDKIDSLLDVLRPYGVLEVVRTGRVAMARGGGAHAAGAARGGGPRAARSRAVPRDTGPCADRVTASGLTAIRDPEPDPGEVNDGDDLLRQATPTSRSSAAGRSRSSATARRATRTR